MNSIENQKLIADVIKKATKQRNKTLGAAKRLNARASMIATELTLLVEDCQAEGLDPSMTEACLLMRCDQLLDEDAEEPFRAEFSFD